MTRRRLRGALVALGAAVAMAGAAACGSPDLGGTAGDEIEELPADHLPGDLLGLPVNQEDMSEIVERSQNAYVEAVGMYALRHDDLVQATIQISRFRDDAPIETANFRSSLISQIGGARAQPFRMGDDTVYMTSGRKQSIAIWFADQDMYVLSVRDTFEFPRSLLRATLKAAR